jgi:hypothetical protein
LGAGLPLEGSLAFEASKLRGRGTIEPALVDAGNAGAAAAAVDASPEVAPGGVADAGVGAASEGAASGGMASGGIGGGAESLGSTAAVLPPGASGGFDKLRSPNARARAGGGTTDALGAEAGLSFRPLEGAGGGTDRRAEGGGGGGREGAVTPLFRNTPRPKD